MSSEYTTDKVNAIFKRILAIKNDFYGKKQVIVIMKS